jgi:hormone-sensitive lipase
MKNYPPIRMYCGDNDFMIDDSYSFIRKLANLNLDAKLSVYKYLIHGYLNFNIPMAVQDVRKVILKVA